MLATTLLSSIEKQFIQEGVAEDIRNDGRSRIDYRPFTLETGIISQANGSARVVLDATSVLVGIKAEVEAPDPTRPSEGIVKVHIDRWGSEDDKDQTRMYVTRAMQNVVSYVDTKSLCLREGLFCWALYVDIIVLNEAGNLTDAVGIATRAALATTTIPEVTVIAGDKPDDYDLQPSDDPEDIINIDVSKVPIAVTFTRIGNFHVVDTTPEEEACMTARVSVTVNKAGDICGIEKGYGSLSLVQLKEVLQVAQSVGVKIIGATEEIITKEKAPEHSTRGFFV
mmetsp:Transcript_15210/g.16913  ORF Transcript_15210/g.16913 Transcript_15210/m.16913 type:complete len:282 (+) Transcript_15210:28-873(+)